MGMAGATTPGFYIFNRAETDIFYDPGSCGSLKGIYKHDTCYSLVKISFKISLTSLARVKVMTCDPFSTG
jgi:hypothetical protein